MTTIHFSFSVLTPYFSQSLECSEVYDISIFALLAFSFACQFSLCNMHFKMPHDCTDLSWRPLLFWLSPGILTFIIFSRHYKKAKESVSKNPNICNILNPHLRNSTSQKAKRHQCVIRSSTCAVGVVSVALTILFPLQLNSDYKGMVAAAKTWRNHIL